MKNTAKCVPRFGITNITCATCFALCHTMPFNCLLFASGSQFNLASVSAVWTVFLAYQNLFVNHCTIVPNGAIHHGGDANPTPSQTLFSSERLSKCEMIFKILAGISILELLSL